jgi:hypothetical protein
MLLYPYFSVRYSDLAARRSPGLGPGTVRTSAVRVFQ